MPNIVLYFIFILYLFSFILFYFILFHFFHIISFYFILFLKFNFYFLLVFQEFNWLLSARYTFCFLQHPISSSHLYSVLIFLYRIMDALEVHTLEEIFLMVYHSEEVRHEGWMHINLTCTHWHRIARSILYKVHKQNRRMNE